MHAVDGIQVAGCGQLGGELAPRHLENLVGDVSLDHFHKVLHLVSVELQLTELHRAAGALHQRCGFFKQTDMFKLQEVKPLMETTDVHLYLEFKVTQGIQIRDVNN